MEIIFDKLEKKGYSKMSKLEEGGYGEVYKFKLIKDKINLELKKGDNVAIKIINYNDDDDTKYLLFRELEINEEFRKKYKSLKYKENIIKIFETFKFDKYAFIVMEIMDGDLFDYLIRNIFNNNGFYKNKELVTIYIGRELLRGLESLHKLDIIHNDIKPENILVNIKKNTAERICFTDYGCAYYKNKKKEECTTLIYSSPELLKKIFYDDKIIINKKSDIFSLGIILYQIYNLNEHPFDSNNFEIQMKIPIKDYEIIDSINNKFLANLVLSMLQYEPEKRPSATELLKIIDNYCKKKYGISNI